MIQCIRWLAFLGLLLPVLAWSAPPSDPDDLGTIEASSIRHLRKMVRAKSNSPKQSYTFVAALVHAAKHRPGANFQDDKDAIFVNLTGDIVAPLLDQPVGCLVKVTCRPTSSDSGWQRFQASKFEVLDSTHRIIAVPAKVEAGTLGTPLGWFGQAQGVAEEALVESWRTQLQLGINRDTKLRVTTTDSTDRSTLRKWIQKEVRVEGCVSRFHRPHPSNTFHELTLMSDSQVTLLGQENPSNSLDDLNTVLVDSIDIKEGNVRVSLHGTVAYSDGISTVVVINGPRRYWVKSKFACDLKVGRHVVIEGLSKSNHAKDMHFVTSRIVNLVEMRKLPAATPIETSQLASRQSLPALVRVRGRVQKTHFHDQNCTLFLKDGDCEFMATISLTDYASENEGFSIKENSLVELSGVPIRTNFKSSSVSKKNRPAVNIMLASPDVANVVEQPLFISHNQAISTIGILAFTFISVLAWTYSLRRQVAVRTHSLSELSNRMHTAFEAMREAVIITDSSGKIVHVNRRFSQIFGYEPLPGHPFEDSLAVLNSHFDQNDFADHLKNHTRAGSHGAFAVELQVEREPLFLDVYAGPIVDSNDQHLGHLFVFDDVTQQQTLQKNLTDAQKMEAVGRLSGGIAHDFNNFLTVINSSLETIAGSAGPDVRPCVDAAASAADRAADLTQQLLGFARRSCLNRSIVSVDRILTEVYALVSRVVEPSVDFRLVNNAQGLFVNVDANRIEQALINLCLNAYDEVSKDTGKISLSAKPYSHPEFGPSVCISIQDNGKGIREEVLRKIFEPFFTTKNVGEGTGLGLSVAQGVIEQHGGEIKVESQLESDTVFKVLLPISERPSSSSESNSSTATQARQLQILVVDDEPLVRRSIASLVESLRHKVVVAENGMQAIRSLATHSYFDLVLLDLTMPEMSGWETYQEIKSAWPEQRIVFCSGYSGDWLDLKDDKGETPKILAKPIRLEVLQTLLA